ncbi:permease [Bradyrhizobium sp. 2TAF24]|uniref:permease n=1 Tax=Bradyrhizobium sp. 2TAF24 TaxID=3233011 RepID=UPI003F8F89E3
MSAAISLGFIAQHEIRLAWRDFLGMLTAGRPARARGAVIGLVVFAIFLHLPAYAIVGRFADIAARPDKTTLIVIAASLALGWALILSQAMESVTRMFYARADLDLIMSSPIALSRLFSVRMAAIALTVTVMALLLSVPFVDVLVIGGGARWLSAFGVVIAVGLSAAAAAIGLTIVLFRAIGPKRTRLVAQIVAAVIGAGFVIALQIAAILSYGTLSRFAVLTSDAAAAFAPDADSPLWWPVRAMLGEWQPLLALLAASLVVLGVTMMLVVPNLGEDIARASSAVAAAARQGRSARRFPVVSRVTALRRKELLLLRRDPWLVSQTLMQLLYLVPPAVMLWRSFSDSGVAVVLITPVIVMAAGQLAGGLAWLTISGEDAADLVATAPSPPAQVIRAKVEVVLLVIAVVSAPLVVPLMLVSAWQAAVTAAGVGIAALSATAVQLWFRVQARRSQFRRRQTSSRLATFAEAFSSIGWAATSALVLAWPLLAAITAGLTLGMLALTWAISPKRS